MLTDTHISSELAQDLNAFLMRVMAKKSGFHLREKEIAQELHTRLTEPELFPSGTDAYDRGESGSESKS